MGNKKKRKIAVFVTFGGTDEAPPTTSDKNIFTLNDGMWKKPPERASIGLVGQKDTDVDNKSKNRNDTNYRLLCATTSVDNSPIVNLHGNERYKLVALNLGQLASHHVRHLVQVSHLRIRSSAGKVVSGEC